MNVGEKAICKNCKKTIKYVENGYPLRSNKQWVHKNGFQSCSGHFRKYRKETYAEPTDNIELRNDKLNRIL